MWPLFFVTLQLVLSVSSPGTAIVQEPELVLVDRVVAIVNGDTVLHSDLIRARSLGTKLENVSDRELLDRMIDERLRLHEIERFESVAVPLDEIELQVELLRERLGGQEVLASTLDEAGMSLEDLRETFVRQLLIMNYVDERLGARVFVDLDDVRKYYEEEVVPPLRQAGGELPPLANVQEQIRGLLRERRLDAEIESWTQELRQQADIQDLLEEVPNIPPRGVRQQPEPPI